MMERFERVDKRFEKFEARQMTDGSGASGSICGSRNAQKLFYQEISSSANSPSRGIIKEEMTPDSTATSDTDAYAYTRTPHIMLEGVWSMRLNTNATGPTSTYSTFQQGPRALRESA